LLASAGVEFDVVPAGIDETRREGEPAKEYVARLSREKAVAVGEHVVDRVVLAADTTVAIDGHLLEKPLDDGDARRMLTLLSGRVHDVHTGVTLMSAGRAETFVVHTAVTFAALDDASIDWYLSTGEHRGKAGAYGIQGAAAGFVERIDGSVTNVIGLPLAQTLALLRRPPFALQNR
jgi:septum formation protein